MVAGGPYLPVAYDLGCSSGWVAHPGSVRNLVLFVSPGQPQPAFAARWQAHHMNGLVILNFIAYTPSPKPGRHRRCDSRIAPSPIKG